MKFKIKISNQFKKDFKNLKKQNKNLDLLKNIIDLIANEEILPIKNHDHSLTGNYFGFRECHVTSDWLLIYLIDNENKILNLVRSGSHSELF